MTEAIAVVHFDERGELNFFHTAGVRMLIVDDRAPGDRVYEMSDASTPAEIARIVGGDEIGSKHDSRHAALSARVLEMTGGPPRLRIVDVIDGEST